MVSKAKAFHSLPFQTILDCMCRNWSMNAFRTLSMYQSSLTFVLSHRSHNVTNVPYRIRGMFKTVTRTMHSKNLLVCVNVDAPTITLNHWFVYFYGYVTIKRHTWHFLFIKWSRHWHDAVAKKEKGLNISGYQNPSHITARSCGLFSNNVNSTFNYLFGFTRLVSNPDLLV